MPRRPLARLDCKVAIEALREATTDIQVVGEIAHNHSFLLRACSSIPVALRPEGSGGAGRNVAPRLGVRCGGDGKAGRPAGPPDCRTRTPGQMARTDSPAPPSRQPASDTPRRRRPVPHRRTRRHVSPAQRRPTWLTGHSGEKPTAQRHFLVSPAAPDLAHRPQWRETDSPASLCRQPSRARPGSPATVARNGQPSVTLSSAQCPAKPPAPVAVLAERGPDLVAADPVRNKLRRPASAVRRSVGAAHPASAATRRSRWPIRSRPHPPTRTPTQPAATARRHLAPAPPPHSALALSLPATPANANANPTGRSRPATPRTPRPGDHGAPPLRHSAGRTARRRPPDPGQFERQISSPW